VSADDSEFAQECRDQEAASKIPFRGVLSVKRLFSGSLFVLSLSLFGCGAPAPNPVVVIETSMGTIKAELYLDRSPDTVKNFLMYVDDKHYDGTVFHRVIPDFMIQGGGFEPGSLEQNDERQTREPIKNESNNGLLNERGTLAMARTGEPDSATSQFFINVKDNRFLDRARARDKVGYCVFGKVIEGMAVVDKIRNVETHTVKSGRGEHENVPKEDVVIKSIRRAETKE
jgi:cyclophilin family peptidyl-prolyl cis-trans isomerase